MGAETKSEHFTFIHATLYYFNSMTRLFEHSVFPVSLFSIQAYGRFVKVGLGTLTGFFLWQFLRQFSGYYFVHVNQGPLSALLTESNTG